MYQTYLCATSEKLSINGWSSVIGGHVNKSVNPEKVCKQLFLKEEDSSHVKYKCRTIGRLISIEVL